MLPIVIVAALALALLIRWWAVPLVAAGWGVLIADSLDAGGYVGALAIAVVNGLVGAALGVTIARAVRVSRSAPVRR